MMEVEVVKVSPMRRHGGLMWVRVKLTQEGNLPVLTLSLDLPTSAITGRIPWR